MEHKLTDRQFGRLQRIVPGYRLGQFVISYLNVASENAPGRIRLRRPVF
jgi:hypothetical protein